MPLRLILTEAARFAAPATLLARLGLLIHREHKRGPDGYHYPDCPRCSCRKHLR